jgi:hypothetical protein
MSMIHCPACNKLISDRFPLHDCKPVCEICGKALRRNSAGTVHRACKRNLQALNDAADFRRIKTKLEGAQ